MMGKWMGKVNIPRQATQSTHMRMWSISHLSLWASQCGHMMLLSVLLLILQQPVIAAENLRFYGVLSAQPCDIASEDESIAVHMPSILNHALYQHQRSAGILFHIHLIDCKPELANSVRVMFKGQESKELQGLLRIPGIQQAETGVAIGLEQLDGKPVAFNQATTVQQLSSTHHQISLRAFVQAEPKAIASKSIALGPFHAISTFTLEYE